MPGDIVPIASFNTNLCVSHLKEFYVILFSFSSLYLNRLLSEINIAPITNLFPKYHMSKHYRTLVNGDTNNNKKVRK